MLLWEVMTLRSKQAWTRIDQALERMNGPSAACRSPALPKPLTRSLTSGNNPHVEDKSIYDKLHPLAEQRINTQLLTPYEVPSHCGSSAS